MNSPDSLIDTDIELGLREFVAGIQALPIARLDWGFIKDWLYASSFLILMLGWGLPL